MIRRIRTAGLTAAMGLGLALVFTGPAEAGGGFGKKKAACATPAYTTAYAAPVYSTGCHTPKLKMPKLPKMGCGGGLKLPKLGCGKKKADCAPAPVVYSVPECATPAPVIYDGGYTAPSAQVMAQPQGVPGAPMKGGPAVGYPQGGYPQGEFPQGGYPQGMGMPGMPTPTMP